MKIAKGLKPIFTLILFFNFSHPGLAKAKSQNFTREGISYSTQGELLACAGATLIAREYAEYACKVAGLYCTNIAERDIGVWYEREKIYCKAVVTFRGDDLSGDWTGASTVPSRCYVYQKKGWFGRTRYVVYKTYVKTVYRVPPPPSRGKPQPEGRDVAQFKNLSEAQDYMKQLVQAEDCIAGKLN